MKSQYDFSGGVKGKYAATLYRATLPHFCCGFLVVNRGGVLTIVDSAPIMRWAMGKPLAEFVAWAKSKGGTVEHVIKDEEE